MGYHHLGNNVLSVLTAIKPQFLSDVCQGDSRVGEGDHSDASLDDIVSQTNDEGVSSLRLELLPVAIQSVAKQDQVPIPYRWSGEKGR